MLSFSVPEDADEVFMSFVFIATHAPEMLLLTEQAGCAVSAERARHSVPFVANLVVFAASHGSLAPRLWPRRLLPC